MLETCIALFSTSFVSVIRNHKHLSTNDSQKKHFTLFYQHEFVSIHPSLHYILKQNCLNYMAISNSANLSSHDVSTQFHDVVLPYFMKSSCRFKSIQLFYAKNK